MSNQVKQFILGIILLFTVTLSANNNPSKENVESDVVNTTNNSVKTYTKASRKELKEFFVRKKRLENFLESSKKIKKRKYTIA